MNRRLTTLLAALLVPLGLLTGCGLQLSDVPMPRLVSGPTYQVTAEFSDALNLPIDAPVKLDGATVGQVTAVEPGEYVALVSLDISTQVELTSTTSAEIRLTSPMGTAFVQLLPGRNGTPLADGDVIPSKRTGEAPDVADLLSALSTVVTGGSFQDISTIIKQLNVALTGNAGTVRRLLRRLDSAVTNLNDEFPTIDRLTHALNRLSKQLAADMPAISDSMVEMAELAVSLERQRTTMMTTLDALRRFDAVATPYTQDIQDDLVRNLRSLTTVLATLAAEKNDIDQVLRGLVAFAAGSEQVSPGDYANFDLTFLLDREAMQAYEGDLFGTSPGGEQ